MIPRHIARWAAVLACGLMLPPTGWPAVPAAETVPLPPVLVEESRFPLRWTYVQAPGLEVLTTCSRSVAREFVETYLRQEHLIRTVIPARYLDASIPVSVLLIDEETAERLVDATMARVLAENTPRAPARSWDRARVMPNIRLDDRDHSVVLSLRQRQFSDDVSFAFATGRIAYLLERLVPSPPPWLAAGLVGLYDQCTFGEDRVQVSPLAWSTRTEAEELRRVPDWPRDVLPLPAMFALLPAAAEPSELRRWREQVALFVRWAVVAEQGKRADGFWRFADHCRERVPDETIFRACFDMDLAEARDRLSDYLSLALEETILLRAEPLMQLPPIRPRPATALESGRLRSEWARLEAAYVRTRHPELYSLYLREARQTLDRALASAGPAPELRALSGLLAHAAGESELAASELEAALAAGATRPLAAYMLARLRWEEYQGAAGPVTLDAAQTGFVLAPLQTARRSRPALPEVYALFTDVWLHSALAPTDQDLAVVHEGVRQYPAVAGIVGRAALLLAQRVDPAAGLHVVEASLDRIAEEPRRAVFVRLRQEIADRFRPTRSGPSDPPAPARSSWRTPPRGDQAFDR